MRTLLMFAALLVPGLAHAEDVDVEQAVALYREHSPRLAAERAQVDVAHADVVDARLYPNPTLGLSAMHTVAGTDTIGHTEPALSLDIPILIGHQRARREEAAGRHVDAARAAALLAQGDGELEIRARFAALLEAQEQRAILTAALADTKTLREVVLERTKAGAGSAYAVERIDLAIAELASRLDAAIAAETDAAGDLATAVGMPGWHPHALGTLAPTATVATALDPQHPARLADRAAIVAAHADIARAKADGVPTPSIGLQTFATSDPSGLIASLGVSIPLPLFDRNQGAVARARAEEHRGELEAAARDAELTAELARASAVLEARREAVAHFQADALQRLDTVRAMAEASYKSGQGGIVELLDALDAITDARLRDLELRGGIAEAELAVRRAAHGR